MILCDNCNINKNTGGLLRIRRSSQHINKLYEKTNLKEDSFFQYPIMYDILGSLDDPSVE